MKDLELKEFLLLTKNAIDKANKDLGFVKPILERKEFQMAPYDPEKDIKLVEFTPTEWGIKGTPTAEHVDAILENIIKPTESNPLDKVKVAFKKLKQVLGPEMTSTGLPVSTKTASSDIHERFAVLQLKATLYTIFHGFQAAQSGKIFESLIARIVGGYQANKDDSRIEDIRDEQGNFISLKAIDRKTGVTGSAKNLALGIIAADKVKKGNGVIYLVCVKDLESSPLYFKAFSFLINKENYFNFILENPSVSAEDIQKASAKILKTQLAEATAAKGGDIVVNASRLRDSAEIYSRKYLGWDETKGDVGSFINSRFADLYNTAKDRAMSITVDIKKVIPKKDESGQITDKFDEVTEKVSLYDIFTKSTDKYDGLFPVMKELPKLFDRGGKLFVNHPIYMILAKEFPRLNVNVANLGKYLDANSNVRELYDFYEKGKSLSYEKEKELINILRQNSQKYKDIYKSFVEDPKVTEFLKFLDQFINTVDEYRYSSRTPEAGTPAGKIPFTSSNPVEDFFTNLEKQETERLSSSDLKKDSEFKDAQDSWRKQRGDYLAKANLEESLLVEAATTTTFDVSINNIMSLAAAVGADLDQDYETVVIDTGYLFESGTGEEKNIKLLLEQSFREQHELRQRYIQYYGYREVEGLQKAADSLERQKNIISELQKLPVNEDETDSQSAQKQPSQVSENKKINKQVLTDDFFNDIKKMIL